MTDWDERLKLEDAVEALFNAGVSLATLQEWVSLRFNELAKEKPKTDKEIELAKQVKELQEIIEKITKEPSGPIPGGFTPHLPFPFPSSPGLPWQGGGCAACAQSGICHCVRYDRLPKCTYGGNH